MNEAHVHCWWHNGVRLHGRSAEMELVMLKLRHTAPSYWETPPTSVHRHLSLASLEPYLPECGATKRTSLLHVLQGTW